MGEDACNNRVEDYCVNSSVAHFNVEIDCYISTQCKCLHQNPYMQTLYGFVPYLYPFTIEFNILVGKLIIYSILSIKRPILLNDLF